MRGQDIKLTEFMLIGHRGCAELEPENTLRGFRKALELGCRMIELDLHVLEGELIVIHDSKLGRTTNGTGNLSDISLEELRLLDAGHGERVPFLSEVMELCRGRGVILNLEIKGEGVAAPLVDLLEDYSEQACIVSSFDWCQLRRCRTLDAKLPIGVLVRNSEDIKEALQLLDELEAVALCPAVRLLTNLTSLKGETLVEAAHASGCPVYPYTVRTSRQLELVLDAGCDGAFCDDPEAVMEWLKMRSQKK